ncbi:MAG: bacteriophage Gp15 family protein [Lachnospiraceae bacterium]|nr:bacteriophage Gp15 family protein [Lachnospiraceae bacterium]MCM1232064.1 bacteriophage Gp15 family protein [Ruminococcus flavefaciens]
MNLAKKKLQETVFVDGMDYAIMTDFRYWLCFARTLKTAKLYSEFDFVYECGNVPADRKAGFNELVKFYNPPQPLPRPDGSGGAKVVDFEQDADLIFAAFWERYGIDLAEKDLHWHKFLALFRGLHDTKLNEVMGYRCYDERDKTDYRKFMSRMKGAWALEEELSEGEKEAVEKFDGEFA